MKLRIGVKISLGLGIILLLLFTLGLMSVLSLQSSKNDLEQIDKASKKVIVSMQIDREYMSIIAALRGYIAYGDEKYAAQANEGFAKVFELEDNLLKLARDEKKAEVNKLISDTQKYKEIVVNQLLPAVKAQQAATASGNLQRANELDAQATAIGKELVPFAEAISKFLNTAAEDNKQIMKGNLAGSVTTASALIYTYIIGCLLALIIGAAVSIYLTRMIMKPIRAMLIATKAYAAGDLRSDVGVLTHDELGELAAALNTMKGNLKLVIAQIVSSSEQVAASSEELTASAEQSAQATTQVAVTITEVAAGAATQASAVDSTALVVEKLSAGIQQVAANANAVSGMADKTASAANEGDKAVDAAMNQMKSIEKSVSDSAQVVTKLGERSKEIGQIVDAISGIAGQTNLLALNAAIEAARAGEHGKGFAVVAEEVRKLAEQSQEAAKQIASLITEIQTKTDSAVAAMNSGASEVQTGTEVVNNAGQAFKKIVSLIAEVSTEIRGISAAIQQMASGSQQIVASVQDIDKISKEAAGQTQTVSAATEEQSASMEEIAASSQALAKMAEELQSAVRKFTI